MRITRPFLIAAVCALAPVAALAEPPAGDFSVTIGGAAQLRLLDGTLGPDCDNGTPTEICTTSVMHTDAAGVVTGTETREYEAQIGGATEGTLTFVFNGTAKAHPGLAKSKLLFVPEGTLTTNGLPGVASGKGKAFCRDDILTGDTFECDAKVRLCFEDFISTVCDRFFTSITLPQQKEDWDLDITDLVTDERGLVTGAAQATLANGVVIDFTVTGKYSEKADTANLNMKGIGVASKSKITLKRLNVQEGVLVGGRVKFKVAGQSGIYEIPLPTPP